MKTKLEAIFFDLDDTLFSTSLFAERARRASVAAMVKTGLRMEPEDLLIELEEVVAEFSSNYDHHFDQLLRRVPKRFYKGVNPTFIISAGIIAYHETKTQELQPFPDALEFLKALTNTTLTRGIITSGLSIKQAEKILRLGIYELLTHNALFISEQIGINKPNVKLYKRACSDLNLKPSQCIYIGDRAPRDIDPPKSIGMTAIHMVRGGKHAGAKGNLEPDYTVNDYYQFAEIL
ncbi:MAG: HAD-IA family hydrolase, partial [Planctomycetota bacterium]|nr:HAD-IA family hydrolase [Planctomycetota bacterium]